MKSRVVPIPDGARRTLVAADRVLGDLIERIGPIEYEVRADLWSAVVGSIVAQQLSVRAAATIRERIARLGGGMIPAPEAILSIPESDLRSCGLSRAKTAYVREAADRWLSGAIDPVRIAGASDEEVIDELVQFRGVGRWTAEMVLIFGLGREDVLAVDDLGIRSAVQRAYRLDSPPGTAEVLEIGEAWRPYRSYASVYLWRSLQP